MRFYSVEYFETIKKIVLQYAWENYDYCYLEAMHSKNQMDECIDTIVVGSSHSMNGIVEERLLCGSNVINYSVSSQDIYYDFLHIKKAVENSKGDIKRCIINLGYYMLYQDLSKSANFTQLIQQVYYPLFGDAHHYVGEQQYDFMSKLSGAKQYYNREVLAKLCEEWARGFFIEESSYYGSLKTREKNNILGLQNIEWALVDKKAKVEYAINRTNGHNGLKKYTESFLENVHIIEKMTSYLYEHNIIPIFVIMPFTNYYNMYINPEYKFEIYQVLDSLKVPVEFLDMNDYSEIFEDADFLDSDHLNYRRAIKATELLNDLLLEIEGGK